MDFLQSTLKDEIEKKRKALQAAKANDTAAANKKYISRAELERLREKEYLEEQERERKKKEEQQAAKEKSRQKELADKEKKDSPVPTSDTANEEPNDTDTYNISQDEVVRRLRARGQPIRLFAETDKSRKARLRTLELMEERSEGQRNDFMRTLEQMDAGMNLEALKRKAAGEDDTSKPVKKTRDDALIEPVQMEWLQKQPEKLYPTIYGYFKKTLREWEVAMEERPEEVKRSGQGKRAAAMQMQTATYLKPLFKQLKSKSMEPDILARVTEITYHMQNRRYRDAQDSYLQLSIGNSPWPIGVTMVGIHERSAREKIHAAQVAHVLNDETSRKWIQSLKRLMTFAQSKYPPDSMSQMA
ncbi:hypothetical protein NQZ79_g2699 [Umbelopsis isabellina]|nr:hypothetical protein NQZ79_g2699 [Umbelopsis isabellina]